MRRTSIAAAAAMALLGAACGAPPRLALEPVPARDDDRYTIPMPRERVRDDYYDIVDYSFFEQAGQLFDMPRNARKLAGRPKQAVNATPLDEIQDSSWFTNRIGARPVTAAEMARGPNRPQGPDVDHEWTIIAGKTQGVTPGFTIRDARGDRFIIKFDPASDPELATGAEAIGTRLFWALGYNTPENYLVRFDPQILRIDPEAKVRLPLGKRRPMVAEDLAVILAKVPKQADGRIRCIASRFLPGRPLGPIPLLGVRGDDPNDVIRHEHRRELRAYKYFCAWVNHNDSREINTLDVYVEDGGRKYVRHYLIDFGAILGSASTGPNLRSEGYEHIFDLGVMAKSLFSLGLYPRPWENLQFPALRGIGRFEAAHFDPGGWKPNYPCPPFENATARDAFWAAKRIAAFDDSLLAAAVAAAEFSDPAASAYMLVTLRERRDRVVRAAFAEVNPLDEFVLATEPLRLEFADLAVRHHHVPRRRYQATIADGRGRRLWRSELDAASVPLAGAVAALGTPDAADVEARLLRVEIRSASPGGWSRPLQATLYLHPSGSLRLAAIERD
jgi:hypothetical protein